MSAVLSASLRLAFVLMPAAMATKTGIAVIGFTIAKRAIRVVTSLLNFIASG
jgi:hypothetical protein